MQRLRFGFIATGIIARRLATAVRYSKGCQLVAAASRSEEKARAFAEEFGVEPVVGYEKLLERDDIDAVYIATPHPQHHEWCLRAIEAGKHILCEKPFTMNFAELEEIVQAAARKKILLAEAFMYRFHPQTRKMVELISSGIVGEVRWIHADFGFAADYQPEGRLFANALGGGGILDVGCYGVSMARLIAGAASSKAFLDPISVQGLAQLNPVEATDSLAGALLQFPGNIFATVRCATRFNLGHRVRIEGEKGTIELNAPWIAGSKNAHICIQQSDQKTIIETEDTTDLYTFMLDEFAHCWRNGKTESPIMSPADSLGNMQVLEKWYRQVGVQYR